MTSSITNIYSKYQSGSGRVMHSSLIVNLRLDFLDLPVDSFSGSGDARCIWEHEGRVG